MHTKIQEALQMLKTSGTKATVHKIISKTLGAQIAKSTATSEVAEKIGMIEALDISTKDWEAHWNIINNHYTGPIKTINWLIPRFEHVYYGGVYTLFRFAEYFQKHGIENRIILYDYPAAPIEQIRTMIAESFPGLASVTILPQTPNLSDTPDSDATIATFWTSAFISARINNTKKKLYFIQDFEPGFYAANSYYALAESTYRMGFHGIVNTPGLSQWLESHYQMKTVSFTPAINHELYSISSEELEKKLQKTEPIQLVVYARPHHERNGFELALSVCKKLKNRFGTTIRIIAAGDEWEPAEYGVEGIIENRGRLNSLQAVADLYRASDIGLVFMFTKHPSYQPFEFMACGAVVATNSNSANTWFLHNENAVIMEPIPSLMVEKISELIENPQKRAVLARTSRDIVQKLSWDAQCQKVLQNISSPMK